MLMSGKAPVVPGSDGGGRPGSSMGSELDSTCSDAFEYSDIDIVEDRCKISRDRSACTRIMPASATREESASVPAA